MQRTPRALVIIGKTMLNFANDCRDPSGQLPEYFFRFGVVEHIGRREFFPVPGGVAASPWSFGAIVFDWCCGQCALNGFRRIFY
jgi:hypothetical protein